MEFLKSLIVYMQNAWSIPSCYHLIYSSFSLHIKHIIELGRTKGFRLVRLNATSLKNIVQSGNKVWIVGSIYWSLKELNLSSNTVTTELHALDCSVVIQEFDCVSMRIRTSSTVKFFIHLLSYSAQRHTS